MTEDACLVPVAAPLAPVAQVPLTRQDEPGTNRQKNDEYAAPRNTSAPSHYVSRLPNAASTDGEAADDTG